MTRQKVIEMLSEIRFDYNCFDEYEKPFYEALNVAIEMLSEEPYRQKGEWKDLNFKDEMWGKMFECSICGEDMIGKWNFCCNCGADMRE